MSRLEDLPRDTLFYFALEFDLPTIFNLCMTSEKLNHRLCRSDEFWSQKLFHDYQISYIDVGGKAASKEIIQLLKNNPLAVSLLNHDNHSDVITLLLSQEPTFWTIQKANNALQTHIYLQVGPKRGFLLLAGAPARWNKPDTADDVYVPSLRVAGKPEIIRQFFIKLGVRPDFIDRHLKMAYTASNYNTSMKSNFDAEVKEAREARRKS